MNPISQKDNNVTVATIYPTTEEKIDSLKGVKVSIDKDEHYRKIAQLRDCIEIDPVKKLIDIGAASSSNLGYTIVKYIKKVAQIAEPFFDWLGYGIVGFSAISIWLGPTPTVTLLSILTGVTLCGVCILLGKIATVVERFLEWLEGVISESYFSGINEGEEKTLNQLRRQWHLIEDPSECRETIKAWIKRLKPEKLRKEEISEATELTTQLEIVKDRIRHFSQAKRLIERKERAGGLELRSYLLNHPL